jgi:putative aminopeptidase FrvX
MFLRKKKNKEASKPNMKKFILETFLTLTQTTYPHGFESSLADEMIRCGLFPSDIGKDVHGNYFYKIGESRTMFTSHLDTAGKDFKIVNHIFDKNLIKTDGNSILGADDKAGLTIMIYMMNNKIPGLYYFFVGEEVGCIGSGLAAKHLNIFKDNYDRCVSFDRRGTDSVITYQSSARCCSDEFANQLAEQLNKTGLSYKIDDSGIYTDSAEFTGLIPECTNLSVGYYNEHCNTESQDIDHLARLAYSCLNVEWEKLATKRDPSKDDYKSWEELDCYSAYYGRGRKTYGVGPMVGSNSGNWRNRDYTHDPNSFRNSSDPRKVYGYHDDFYEEDDFNKKKTRRGGKRPRIDKKKNKIVSRTFYDDGSGNLIEKFDVPVNSKGNVYEWIRTKFMDEKLSSDELEVIRDQYFNMNNEEDRKFYDIVRAHVISDSGR